MIELKQIAWLSPVVLTLVAVATVRHDISAAVFCAIYVGAAVAWWTSR